MAWSLNFYFILFLTEKIKRMWKRSLAREIGRWDAYLKWVWNWLTNLIIRLWCFIILINPWMQSLSSDGSQYASQSWSIREKRGVKSAWKRWKESKQSQTYSHQNHPSLKSLRSNMDMQFSKWRFLWWSRKRNLEASPSLVLLTILVSPWPIHIDDVDRKFLKEHWADFE